MAFIVLIDGTTRTLPADKALAVWKVYNKEEQGTVEQRLFCARIKRIYLNKLNAPESYLKRNELEQKELYWQK